VQTYVAYGHAADARRSAGKGRNPLFLEYEEAARGLILRGGLSARDIDDILDYMCSVARHGKIFYL
jgi:hypothetical protein